MIFIILLIIIPFLYIMITRYKTNNELLIYKKLLAIHLSSLILSSFFYHFTFFIPIFLDFFLIFSIFFFKYIINSIEVFTSFNPCYSIFFYNFFSLFFYVQLIILLVIRPITFLLITITNSADYIMIY